MKVLTWAIRLVIFLVLFAFAMQNTEVVQLRFVLGQSWQVPLVILLLAFFSAGALLGVLAVLGHLFTQRREIARLKKALEDAPSVPAPEVKPPVGL